jgi:flagellar export protein FliJ
MAHFKFRLQSVLNTNSRKTRAAATDFAGAIRVLKTYEHALGRNAHELKSLGASNGMPDTTQSAIQIQMIRSRMSKCLFEISVCKKHIEDQRTVIEEKRDLLNQARQEEKKLDMLKTRHYAEWRRAQNRAEQARLDETAGRLTFQKQTAKAS